MKIIVTGSAGFIGAHTYRALVAQGHDVIGLDRVAGVELDRRDAIDGIVAWAPDLIVHLASSVSTPGSVSRPTETFRDTVVTTVNVMEGARLRQTPVLLTSSVKARDGRTPYGAAKVMAETWAREYNKAYGVPVAINRPGTVYGPGQEGSTESGWIAWFLKARDEGLKVTINGSGTQVRDLLFVMDYVALMQKQIDDYVLGRASWSGEIWDVGGGMQNTVTVTRMAQYLGLQYEFGPERYGDALMYVGKNDYPGWEPETLWRDAISAKDSDPDPISGEAAIRS